MTESGRHPAPIDFCCESPINLSASSMLPLVHNVITLKVTWALTQQVMRVHASVLNSLKWFCCLSRIVLCPKRA